MRPGPFQLPKSLLRPAIGLESEIVSPDEIEIGQSHFGGQPDLPADQVWPTHNGRPLAFVAQINLEEASEFSSSLALPLHGWLVFFYDAEEQPWGFDPADAGSCYVLFVEAALLLLRRKLPSTLSNQARFPFMTLRPAQIVTRPNPWSVWVDDLHPTADQRHELAEEMIEEDWTGHQIGGHASCIQNAMEQECELVSAGVPWTPEGLATPRAQELTRDPGARDWRLLLQIESIDDTQFCWGDEGVLYFWIRERDLTARDFSHVWTVLQCT